METRQNTLYTEMEDLQKDIISIHNSVVSVANQLWFAIPMTPENDDSCQTEETTVRNTMRQIKKLVSLTKDRASNLEQNVK